MSNISIAATVMLMVTLRYTNTSVSGKEEAAMFIEHPKTQQRCLTPAWLMILLQSLSNEDRVISPCCWNVNIAKSDLRRSVLELTPDAF